VKKTIPAKHSWLIWFVCFLVMSAAAGWYLAYYLGNIAKKEIINDNEASTNTLSILLTAEFRKMEGAVKALAGSPWIAPALMTKRTIDVEHAYSVLARYNTSVDATVSYLMDSTGMTVASSNRNDPDSFVGHSYVFRPYFREAALGNTFSYLALGITSRKNGFYTSAPVMDNRKNILGVVTIKKELYDIEAHMRKYPYCFLIDANGIIFLSSKPAMAFKSLWPINVEVEKKLLASKQFGEKRFDAVMDLEITDGMNAALDGKDFVVSRKPINLEGWSIVLMAPKHRINVYRLTGILTAGFIFLLLAIPLIIHYRTVKLIETIRQSEERYHSLFENMLEGFAYCEMLYDEQNRPVDFVYLDVNKAFERLTGLKDLEGKKVTEAIPGIKELNPELFKIYGRVALTGKTEKFEIYFKPLAKHLSVSVYSPQKGYFVAVFDDITEQKRLNEQLHTVSLTDELTGLYNRRGFFTLAQQQMKIAERTKKDMLLFFADLDKMKHINDTLGHQEGDKALVEIATILKEVFRESDIIGRMGGDEFAILAIDTTDETREVLIHRLRNILDNYNRPEGKNYQLALSIGIARYNTEASLTLDELMTQADTLMYEEKRGK